MHTSLTASEQSSQKPLRRHSLSGSLRVRLMLMALLTLFPVLGLFIFNHSEQRHRDAVEAQASALRLARSAASDQAQLIEATRQLLVVLAQIPSVQSLDTASCNRFMADLLRQLPLYQNLAAATPDGNVYCSAVPYATPTNVAGHDDFQGALRTKGFAVSDYRRSLITGKPSVSFAYPVVDESGEVYALVSAILDLTWLDEFVARAELPEGSTLSIIGGTGTVVTRYPDPEQWRGQIAEATGMPQMFAADEGVYEGAGIDGVTRFYGFTRLCCMSSGDVFVRVGVSKATALAVANRTLRRNLLALGTVALIALALASLSSHLFVLQPVNAILRAVKKIDAGDLSARVGQVFAGGTLGNLAESLDRAAESLERRETELRRTHQRLQIYTAHTEALALEAGRLGSRLDLATVASTACKGAASLLNVRAASISLWDEATGTLRNFTDCGLPPEFRDQTQPLSRSAYEDLFGRRSTAVALHTPAHLNLPDTPLYCALDIRKVVSAPMLRDGQLVGLLNLYMLGKDRRFSEDELNHLKAFADQASLAITNARLYESLRKEERAHADLLRSLISAQEDERKRIARELHDETGQELGALMLELESAVLAQAAGRTHDSEHVQTAKSIARRLMLDIRRLVSDLRPALLDDLGLVPAIAWYADNRLKSAGIEVEMLCDRTEIRLPQSVEITLFRIAQEAISNVVRHSEATRVAIRMRSDVHQVVMAVEDNGRGFEVSPGDAPGTSVNGFGLQGIAERVSILGGDFTLRSTPGRGTLVEIRVPLTESGG